MKKKISQTIIILLAGVGVLSAQEQMDKYCKISIKRNFGYRVSIDTGTPGLFFKDSAMISGLQQVITSKNDIDVIDSMSSLGWSLVTSSFLYKNTGREFYFKKSFSKNGLPASGNSN